MASGHSKLKPNPSTGPPWPSRLPLGYPDKRKAADDRHQSPAHPFAPGVRDGRAGKMAEDSRGEAVHGRPEASAPGGESPTAHASRREEARQREAEGHGRHVRP